MNLCKIKFLICFFLCCCFCLLTADFKYSSFVPTIKFHCYQHSGSGTVDHREIAPMSLFAVPSFCDSFFHHLALLCLVWFPLMAFAIILLLGWGSHWTKPFAIETKDRDTVSKVLVAPALNLFLAYLFWWSLQLLILINGSFNQVFRNKKGFLKLFSFGNVETIRRGM